MATTDNKPQNNQALMDTWPYELEYQVVAESALVGLKLFCWLQLMAASAYGDWETQHFYRHILWAQLHLVQLVLLFRDAFL